LARKRWEFSIEKGGAMTLTELKELFTKFVYCLALPYLMADLLWWTSAGQEHVAMAWLDHKLGRVIG
jgi:hypothetical protein